MRRKANLAAKILVVLLVLSASVGGQDMRNMHVCFGFDCRICEKQEARQKVLDSLADELLRPEPSDTAQSSGFIAVVGNVVTEQIGLREWRTYDTDTLPLPDTTRYYAKVDTCLACPDGYVEIYPGRPDMPKLYYCMQIKFPLVMDGGVQCAGWNGYILPDTTIDTTWCPYYVRVDTVWVCSPGLHLVSFRNLPGWEYWCVPLDEQIPVQEATLRIDTTWLLCPPGPYVD